MPETITIGVMAKQKSTIFRSRALLWALYLAAGYAAFCALMYFMQDRFLYHPASVSRSAAEQQLTQFARARIMDDVHAVVLEEEKPPAATAILFHGNGGHAINRTAMYAAFAARGIRLVIAEYPGYGWRGGSPSETVLIGEGLALYETLRRQVPDGHPVMLVGESLGTGVAVQVAVKAEKPPSRLVLLTPFTSVSDVASQMFWMLPTTLLLRDTYDSAAHIDGYAGPVSVMVAGKDDIIGPDTGLALHRAAEKRGRTSLVLLPESGHNGWWRRISKEDWDTLLISDPGAAP